MTDQESPIDNADAIVMLRSVRSAIERLDETTGRLVSLDYIETWQKEQESKRRNFATLVVAVGICFFILFGFLGYGVWLISHLVEEVRQNSQTTVDCTDPSAGAQCYKDRLKISNKQSQQQTDDIIQGLFKAIIDYYKSGGFQNDGQPPSGH